MARLIIAVVTALVVMGIGYLLQRRRPAPPTQNQWHPPLQLDREDFVDPNKPWLVTVFASAICDACEKAKSAGSFLESNEVAYQVVTVEDNPMLHERYRIEQVPLLLIADSEGVVVSQFIGPPVATEVWAEFAQVRDHAESLS